MHRLEFVPLKKIEALSNLTCDNQALGKLYPKTMSFILI